MYSSWSNAISSTFTFYLFIFLVTVLAYVYSSDTHLVVQRLAVSFSECLCLLHRTKTLVLELLAAICLVSGGHQMILSAFDNFKHVRNAVAL